MTTTLLRAATTVIALAGGTLLAAAPSAQAASCAALPTAVFQRSTGSTDLLSTWSSEATGAAAYGFTTDLGTPFQVSRTTGTGLVAVERWYSSARADFAWARTDQSAALAAAGYTKQKIDFHALAAADAGGCSVPVTEFTKNGRHRYAATQATADALAAAGWVSSGVVFHAGGTPTHPSGAGTTTTTTTTATTPTPTATPAPAPAVDTRFAVAVIPDTQNEVSSKSNQSFENRATWLVSNRAALDLRYVLHTGDVVSWDTADHAMYAKAKTGFDTLTKAGLPWTASIGNHDTAAVCEGGSACFGNPLYPTAPPASVGLRDTTTFNAYFGGQTVSGRFEAGKVDNTYQLWTAGGVQWMTLNLELWPRKEVVAWAKKVLDANPRANVIVSTHMFLDGSGALSTSNGGYGATSPQYLWDTALKNSPNVKLVLNGHTGVEAAKVLTNAAGQSVVALNGTWHLNTPVTRILDIDTATGTVSSRWYNGTALHRSDLDRTYTVDLVR